MRAPFSEVDVEGVRQVPGWRAHLRRRPLRHGPGADAAAPALPGQLFATRSDLFERRTRPRLGEVCHIVQLAIQHRRCTELHEVEHLMYV